MISGSQAKSPNLLESDDVDVMLSLVLWTMVCNNVDDDEHFGHEEEGHDPVFGTVAYFSHGLSGRKWAPSKR